MSPRQSTINVPHPIWQLIYNSAVGVNIHGHIESMAMEVRWHEAMGQAASDIAITVEDSKGKWHTSTFAQPGDKVNLQIGYAGAPLFNAGTFTIDELEFRTPPDTMTLKGIEAWVTAQLLTPVSVSYENMGVGQMAQLIARKHGWELVSADEPVNPDVPWSRKTQSLCTDLDFLRQLADEHNYVFQVRPPQLIFYSLPALEAQPPSSPTITRAMIHRAEFRYQSLADRTYDIAQHSYLDPHTKQTWSSQAQATGHGSEAVTGNVYNFKTRAENNQQSTQLVTSSLHGANKMQYQGEIEMPGTTSYRAGQTIDLDRGWGMFSSGVVGNWIVEEAEHVYAARNGGYKTRLTVRTVGPSTQVTPGGAAGATDTSGSTS